MVKRRILVFHSSSDLYGASNSLVRSLIALTKKNFEPVLILSEPGPLSKLVCDMGIEVRFIRLGVLRKKYFNLLHIWNRLYYTIRAVVKIKNVLRKEKFDIVLTNTVVVISGAIAAKLSGVKHIWHVRETVVDPILFKKFIIELLKRTGDAVFFVSEASRDNYLPWLDKKDLKVIYNGIDTHKFLDIEYDIKAEIGVPQETVLILMVARVSFLKGQHYFLKIAKLLLSENRNLHFAMVGDIYPGNEKFQDELSKFITENKLQGNVTELGFRSDVHLILSGADIFVLPSIKPDSLPTTVLEAMAAGKPVVATDLGGSVEMVIERETGFLVPFDDAKYAAKCLQLLIDSLYLREQMGKRGKARVQESFSLNSYLENFGNAVTEILDR